jgi:hypothetical protein
MPQEVLKSLAAPSWLAASGETAAGVKKLGCAGWAISVVRSGDGNFHACLIWPLGSIMTGEDAWELGIESLGRLIDS